ncbi:MAG: DUF58 domain-containing protein [Chloroflexota bacterium]
MRVDRKVRTLRGSVGDAFREQYEVTNRGRTPALWVEVKNESSLPGAGGSRLLTRVSKRDRRSYTWRTWLLRRGRFPLGPTLLTAGDPFGLFHTQKRFPAKDTLVVLPLIVPISEFPTPAGILPGGKPVSRRSLDITPQASGVREYSPGDPLKRIHWPTTIRKGQFMVKEFDQDPHAEVWLFLDVQRAVHTKEPEYSVPVEFIHPVIGKKPKISLPQSTLEYAIAVTASLVHYFIYKKRAVGFAASGQVNTIIPAERSQRQEAKILENLAYLEAEGDLAIASVVASQASRLPRGSTVILITPSQDNAILSVIDDLVRRNLRPVVVAIQAETFDNTQRDGLLEDELIIRNIPLCQVAYKDDLSRVLSMFVSTLIAKDNTYQWQKPQYTPST